MVAVFKTNEIETIGGTTPQGDGIELSGEIKDWNVVEIADDMISSIQEFNVTYVADDFAEAISGPQHEGAYNAPAYEIGGTGDKLRFELNPGQVTVGVEGVEDGTPMTSPDDMDDRSQKNFTLEEATPYKNAYATIKKITAKSILRDNIRGNIIDLEDDIADTKVAVQTALYYFANEWNLRTEAQKVSNPHRTSMDSLTTKLLSDDVKMRADLSNGIEKLNKIIETEAAINTLITETYKYDSNRGLWIPIIYLYSLVSS